MFWITNCLPFHSELQVYLATGHFFPISLSILNEHKHSKINLGKIVIPVHILLEWNRVGGCVAWKQEVCKAVTHKEKVAAPGIVSSIRITSIQGMKTFLSFVKVLVVMQIV